MTAVQNNERTTRVGGATGRGFLPGQSGNPSGRPKGLARRVRELVGDDGSAIAEFMVTVMCDQSTRTADRIEAAKWLCDRAFGRAPQAIDVGLSQHSVEDFLKGLSTPDLDAMIAILEKYPALELE